MKVRDIIAPTNSRMTLNPYLDYELVVEYVDKRSTSCRGYCITNNIEVLYLAASLGGGGSICRDLNEFNAYWQLTDKNIWDEIILNKKLFNDLEHIQLVEKI